VSNEKCDEVTMPRRIRIIGVPMELGQSRRGVDMGPSALRATGIHSQLIELGYAVDDVGNITVKQPIKEIRLPPAKHLTEIAETSYGLANVVRSALEEKCVPLVFGGDHSIAIGVMTGVSAYYRNQSKQVGYVWLDAHGDMNTPETSPSRNVHGMPLASVIGFGAPELVNLMGFKPKVSPRNVSLVGARDLDSRERQLVKESGIHVFTMRDIDERGMGEVIGEALHFATNGTDGIAVSFDLDFMDPRDAPGVGTPVKGGATYREAHLAMEMIADSNRMISLEVVEINPVNDEHNATAHLAAELILSAMGKKIL
jgi:arginase